MKNSFTLTKLPKLNQKSKKRLGRGYGSGKAKTAGRGTKGQLARGKMPLAFEGGQLSLVKRLPYLRGKSKNKSIKTKYFPIPLSKLHTLKSDTKVTLEQLKKDGIVNPNIFLVKLVSSGNFDKKLTVYLPCSQSAKASIIKSGGSVISENE